MENSNQKNEQLLLDMSKELARKNKTLWISMWVIIGISIAGLLAGCAVAKFLIPEGVWQIVTVIGVVVVCLSTCFFALKLEVSVGVYKCKKCGCEVHPTYGQALWAMHMGTTRYLKCPKCGKRTWCKKAWKD